jgi:hypothetical protein
MRRYGKFTDGIWIQHRMRRKDARVEQDAVRRAARQQADLERQLVTAFTQIYPAGTDMQTIIDAARAALARAGAQ